MAILTSRPQVAQTRSTKDVMLAVEPVISVLDLMGTLIRYPDDSQSSINRAYDMIEDTIKCFRYADYAVMAGIAFNINELAYDVAIKPFADSSFISFKVFFKVQP